MRFCRLTIIGFLLLHTTCSNEEKKELTLDEFIAQYPEAYCSYLMRCCDQEERSFGAKDNCLQATTDAVKELFAFNSSATPYATFSAAKAETCLNGLKASSCTEDPKRADGCTESAVTASHKEGEACTYSVECASFYCNQPQKNVKGTCSSAGVQCSGDDRACLGAAYCNGSRQCVPKLDNALPCTKPNECQSGICAPQNKICLPKSEPYCDGK